jgi:hypothetical protein
MSLIVLVFVLAQLHKMSVEFVVVTVHAVGGNRVQVPTMAWMQKKRMYVITLMILEFVTFSKPQQQPLKMLKIFVQIWEDMLQRLPQS